MQEFGGGGGQGVSGGSPATFFEKLDGDDLALEHAAPFKVMPVSPGRPKGAMNKRTREMRDLYLKSGLPHPLLWQGRMLQLGIDGLRTLLGDGCTRLEAAELLRKIAADALPYLESKMPTAIDVKDERLPVLVVAETSRSLRAARSAGALSIDDDLVDVLVGPEENQGLGDGEDPRSHDAGSHDHAQRLDNAGETGDAAAD